MFNDNDTTTKKIKIFLYLIKSMQNRRFRKNRKYNKKRQCYCSQRCKRDQKECSICSFLKKICKVHIEPRGPNNIQHPKWGEANIPLLRISPVGYENGKFDSK